MALLLSVPLSGHPMQSPSIGMLISDMVVILTDMSLAWMGDTLSPAAKMTARQKANARLRPSIPEYYSAGDDFSIRRDATRRRIGSR